MSAGVAKHILIQCAIHNQLSVFLVIHSIFKSTVRPSVN